MSQSVTPLADLTDFQPALPKHVPWDQDPTNEADLRFPRGDAADYTRELHKPSLRDVDPTRFNGPRTAPAEVRSLEQYRQTLVSLHKQRREVLRLKRLGDPAYREDEYEELRAYIDEFQEAITDFENQKVRALSDRFESLAADLLTQLRR